MFPEKTGSAEQAASTAVGMAEMAAWTVAHGSPAMLGHPSSGYWPSI